MDKTEISEYIFIKMAEEGSLRKILKETVLPEGWEVSDETKKDQMEEDWKNYLNQKP